VNAALLCGGYLIILREQLMKLQGLEVEDDE
jgi:hypothetical protein